MEEDGEGKSSKGTELQAIHLSTLSELKDGQNYGTKQIHGQLLMVWLNGRDLERTGLEDWQQRSLGRGR